MAVYTVARVALSTEKAPRMPLVEKTMRATKRNPLKRWSLSVIFFSWCSGVFFLCFKCNTFFVVWQKVFVGFFRCVISRSVGFLFFVVFCIRGR